MRWLSCIAGYVFGLNWGTRDITARDQATSNFSEYRAAVGAACEELLGDKLGRSGGELEWELGVGQRADVGDSQRAEGFTLCHRIGQSEATSTAEAVDLLPKWLM